MTEEEIKTIAAIKALAEREIEARIGRYDPTKDESVREYLKRAQGVAREVAGADADVYVALPIGENRARVTVRSYDPSASPQTNEG